MTFPLIIALCLSSSSGRGLPAASDDAGDVEEAVRAFYQAINDGDAVAAAEYVIAGADEFPRNGRRRTSFLESAEKLQARFDRGLKSQVEVRELEVKVFGNSAVASYYTTGPTTYTDGTIVEGTFRASAIWIQQARGWKMVHVHISALQTPPD